MTDPAIPDVTSRRRLRPVLLALALIAVAALWWISELYTTDAARECRALYAEARSGIDSNRVDLTVPTAGTRLTVRRSCVYYKGRGR